MHQLADIQPLLDGIIHWDTQQASRGADLTVGQVFELTSPGRLDFGGSAYAAAGREEIAPVKTHAEDDYGWWRLDAGTYIVRYNETLRLAADQHARLAPLDRLLQAGASHPTLTLEDPSGPLEHLLTVGSAGCYLKENCRISRLTVYAADAA